MANFPPVFVNWIHQCISTASFSINLNGALSGHFKATNGLRQGDPLSPSLFVIAMDVFSNLLDRNFTVRKIGFHPKAKKLRITNLAFADDLMIFFDGKPTSVAGITSALEEFRIMSGLHMNRAKTSIFLSGLTDQELATVSHYGFRQEEFPVRYLGLPLLHRKLRKADYSPLLDQLAGKFSHWTTKVLSFAGRLQLISSVIYGTLNFWFSTFMLPKGCLSTIEAMCTRFLWTGNIVKTGGVKIDWSQVCLPKNEGGLGLRRLNVWNKVLNLRLIWMLFTSKDSLWVAWIKEHRFRGTTFWEAPSPSNSSWVWKSLMTLRPLAKQFITCKVLNGRSASYWHDNWTALGSFLSLTGPAGPMQLGIPISATVKEATSLTGWRTPSARTRSSSLSDIAMVLSHTRLPSDTLGDDEFYWTIDGLSLSKFSSRQTWDKIRPSRSLKAWAKVIWYKGYIPKLAFTFWVAHHDRLATRSRMASWNLPISSACCICNIDIETRDHLFFRCPLTAQIWNSIAARLGLTAPPFTDWDSMIQWLSSSNSADRTLRCIVAQATINLIWKERNSRVHNSISLPSTSIISQIDRLVRDTILARLSRKSHRSLLSAWFTYE